MKLEYVFTDNQVVTFCKATCDVNPVHDPDYMYSREKRVIVPGMMLFSKVATMLFGAVGTSLDTYKILINSIVSTNETIVLGYEDGPENEKYIFAINKQDSFSFGKERSKVYLRNFPVEFPQSGRIQSLPVEKWQLVDFGKVIDCQNVILRDFLFGIAYASNALFKSISNPVTEVEKEINNFLDKSKNPDQVSPFYQSLEIFLPPDPNPLKSNRTIDYFIQFEREVAGRVYLAKVRCEQEGSVLYHSEYRLVAIPDKIILRMAKSL
ncbi:MAG TPA: hypothetical protein VLH61_00300 [Bacteroidales bacterium]|nr:hypothetical protein [Bacteroidales bacterium]